MIDYRQNVPLDVREVVRVFESAGLTRPTGDLPRLERVFAHSDLLLSAWSGETLVGFARAITDYGWCCYLADLAVERAHQRRGVGRRLLELLQAAVGDEVSIVLLSAPGAMTYYPHLGFSRLENGFQLKRAR